MNVRIIDSATGYSPPFRIARCILQSFTFQSSSSGGSGSDCRKAGRTRRCTTEIKAGGIQGAHAHSPAARAVARLISGCVCAQGLTYSCAVTCRCAPCRRSLQANSMVDAEALREAETLNLKTREVSWTQPEVCAAQRPAHCWKCVTAS